MDGYLEVGKYYNYLFEDIVIGDENFSRAKISFRVKSIKVNLKRDEEYEPKDVVSDKFFRKEDGSLDYAKYEFEHYIETSFGIDDEKEIVDSNFIIIENHDEIEKVKASIESHVACQADYDEAMASKYPEY